VKKKNRTVSLPDPPALGDEETEALVAVIEALRPLNFDQLWRVFNYVLARRLGRRWILSKPANE
jgi:hypothetical protein